MDEGNARDTMLRWVASHSSMLMAYVYAMVHDTEVARDILGELAVTVGRKAATFDLERPLGPLVRGIARNLCLQALEKARRGPAPVDPVILDGVSGELDAFDDAGHVEERKEALERCVEALPEASRRLVTARYFENVGYADMCARENCTRNSLYIRMSRIHKLLYECVRKGLAEAGIGT